jgi:hypothetical protein
MIKNYLGREDSDEKTNDKERTIAGETIVPKKRLIAILKLKT